MTETATLLQNFQKYCASQPKKRAFSFLNDSGEIVKSLSYADLQRESQAVASHLLKNAGLQKGDRVLLVYPPSLDFIVAFLGCLQAGIIAVPTFPPDPSRLNKDLTMFATIASSCEAKTALTSSLYSYATKMASIKSMFSGSGSTQWPELKWIVTDDIVKNSADIATDDLCKADRDDVAFLQYTSGSTSEPKGVMITHGNLGHNLKLIVTGLKAVEDTIVVSWLPQYHDMGLIGSYLGALYCGGSGYYMSPFSFIRNPPIWIKCISQYKGTHMQAPNFAYALTAKKFLSLAQSGKTSAEWTKEVDLSSVRHMINAAEPVEAVAVDLFHAVFSKYHLPSGVVYPTYGLAEHTVYVCSNGSSRVTIKKYPLEKEQRVVLCNANEGTAQDPAIVMMGCGSPKDSEGMKLHVVHPETFAVLGEDKVGEVWIKSPSRAKGYWNLPEKSKQDFEASISEDLGESMAPGESGFLRTGDLGFMHRGELFICGRSKDLIIIRGRNHYPQDIERTCESLQSHSNHSNNSSNISSDSHHQNPYLRGGCSAAFSVPIRGEETLVYAAEVHENWKASIGDNNRNAYVQLCEKIREEVSKVHGVSASVVALLEPRTISKTTSGKIARQWVRRAYLEGKLQLLHQWSAESSSSSSTSTSADDAFEVLNSNAPVQSSKMDANAMDPTDRPLNEILTLLRGAVAKCTDSSPERVKVDLPLSALGMDSMRGIQLQSQLEKTFTILVPEEILFDPDSTLTTIAWSLINGGMVRSRPVMIEGWKVTNEVRKMKEQQIKNSTFKGQVKGPLSVQWFKEHQVKGDIDNGSFPEKSLNTLAPLTLNQEMYFFWMSFGVFGFFIYVPLFLFFMLKIFSASIALTFAAIAITATFVAPTNMYPPGFRSTYICEIVMRYFSYRMVIEKKFDASLPTIYTMGPHGVFALVPAIQTLLHEYVFGNNFHVLAANAVFYVPGYNVILKMLGFRGIDRDTFKKTLESGRSVCMVPGGIAEMFVISESEEHVIVKQRKGFVRIALETGAQIVPTYNFGHSGTFKSGSGSVLRKLSRTLRMSLILFWGRYGLPIPFRSPITTVFGRPIICPQVKDPSPELVNEYHDLYVRELRRIYEKYRGPYGWGHKELVMT